VTVSGLGFRYTPASGFFGTDRFTYTATNVGGTSAAATVTVTVGTPPAPTASDIAAGNVPFGSTGTAIDLSGAITGVRSAVTIATPPANGTVTISGEIATYIPNADYFGPDRFAFVATGPGGASAPATVTLTVATPAPPVVSDRGGVAVPFNGAGTAIDLANSVSGLSTEIIIVSEPTNGSVTVSGSVVTYRPATDFFGADSFRYTARGPGGMSNVATVGLVVDTPPAPVATPGSASVAGSATVGGTQTIEIDLSALVSGDFDRIEISTQPANGIVTLSGNPAARAASAAGSGDVGPMAGPRVIATYRPNAGFTGTDSFGFVAVGPGGRSAPATITINVVGTAPSAQSKTAQTGDDETVSVDLTAGATEGPFTDARIVSITPADAATATIVASGSGTTRSFRLDVTPAARFGGTVVVTYTLTNAFGTSAPATVTVTARPDPSADPAVRAISDAQAEATRRFARSQVGNFMRRTEQLHNGGGAAPQMGLSIASRDGNGVYRDQLDQEGSGFDLIERTRGVEVDRAPGGMRADKGIPQRSRSDDVAAGDGRRRVGSIGIWSGGAIDIGTRDETSQRAKITATSSGLSAGVDVKLAESLTVGVGGGYGRDMMRIDGGRARLTADSALIAAYASLSPFEQAFVDGMIGRGDLSFASRRLADNGSTAIGSRDGDYIVAALALGIDRPGDRLSWSLYGRGELLEADLGAYRESGSGRFDLRFDERNISSLTGTLGARFEGRQVYDFGTMRPRLRAEWSYEFSDTDAQRLDYADIAGSAFYGIDTLGWRRSQIDLTLGTQLILPSRWSFDIETGIRTGTGELSGTLRTKISREF